MQGPRVLYPVRWVQMGVTLLPSYTQKVGISMLSWGAHQVPSPALARVRGGKPWSTPAASWTSEASVVAEKAT